jgi:hypothetical protein
MRLHLRVLGVLAIVASTAACDESLSTLAGPTPGLEPTFSSIQRDIFETTDVAGRVACVTCHTNVGKVPAGNLVLLAGVSYNNLLNVASFQQASVRRVVPNDPDASYLVRKISGTPGITGLRMPLNGPPYLTSGQIQILRSWIEQGAQNN